jgi:hypothetical protein
MNARLLTAVLMLNACHASWGQTTDPIVHDGIVEIPLERMWAAWTTNAGLQSWLAPHAEVDMRLGGTMRTNYNADVILDDPRTIENTILGFTLEAESQAMRAFFEQGNALTIQQLKERLETVAR